ncbi:MAG: SMC-Scp complex subunit ScpB, partial [Nitriliruptor sp.]|uniref:SMC-Scp complex subunit ScpB n=1 Tax=Nitriliruptor sp. TaxID=2448056 RepID=UPI0034A0987E
MTDRSDDHGPSLAAEPATGGAIELPLEEATRFTPEELEPGAAIAALAALDPVAAAGLEALLFLAEEPLDVLTLAETLELDPSDVDAACQGLAHRHVTERRGTEVRRAAGGWRMYSAALARPVLERWALSGRTGRLTQAALETLAVIAYKQPIGRQEIGEIRGVNADGAVRSLVARGFVAEVGRSESVGQAVLYGTTTLLLERLGIDSLDQLPPLTDFLPESNAPDEPELGRLKEVRQRLAAGGELPGPTDTREAATRRFGDVRARLAVAGAEAPPAAEEDPEDDVLPPPRVSRDDRRDDEAEMDVLTDRLESAARSAVDRLRQAVSATAEREAVEDAQDTPTPQDAQDTPTPQDDQGTTTS